MSSRITIKSIEIKNFASYKEGSIDFTSLDYPVFVVGDNGAGKTTFFVDAVTFGLYGRAYGDVRFRRDLISSFHNIKLMTEVKLLLDYGGIEYHIIRRSGESSESILVIKHEDKTKKLYTSRRDVDKALEELLGLNYENMLETFIVRQGQLTSFILLKPSERRSKLVDLLNINFKPIRERIKNDLIEIQRQLSEYNGYKREIESRFHRENISEISVDIVDKRLREIEENITNKKLYLRKLESKFKVVDGERQRLNKIISRIDVIEKSIRDARKEISKIRTHIYEIINDDIQEEDIPGIIEKLRLMYEEIESEEEKYQDIKDIITLLKEAINSNNEISVLGSKIDEMKGIEEKLEVLIRSRGEYEHRINTLRNNLEQLNIEKDRCPLCGNKLTNDQRARLIDKFLSEKEDLSLRLNEVEKKIRRLREKLKEKESLNEKMNRESGRLASIIEQLNKKYEKMGIAKKLRLEILREEIKCMEEKLNNIKGFIETLKIEANRYLKKPMKDVTSLKMVLDTLKEYLSKLSEYRKSLENNVKELEKIYVEEKIINKEDINKRLSELNERYDALYKEIGSFEKELGSLEVLRENLIELRRKAGEYLRIQRKIMELEYKVRILEKLHNEIFIESGFPLYYLELLVNKILTECVNRYLNRLYPDLEVRYEAGKTGVELKVYMNGRVRDINTLSGGELTILGLATRLGLGELISLLHSRRIRPGFLIIDEGFGPLDEDNRLKVSEVFRHLVDDSLYPQVIVISHEREMMDSNYFNSIIEVYKEDGYSRLELKSF